MFEEDGLPKIVTKFDDLENPNGSFYRSAIANSLRKMLPKNVLEPCCSIPDFCSHLPLLIKTSKLNTHVTFSILSKYRPNAFKFFYEMISHWLVPGRRLDVPFFQVFDFQMPQHSAEETFTLCELMVHIDNELDLDEINKNFATIDTEIRLGMQSSYYARRILEIKGLAAETKTAMIQEDIVHLINRLPNGFNYDLLTEMQHMLVICRDEFKSIRESRHLSRIISIHYYFRKLLREAVRLASEQRHIYLKLFKAPVHFPQGTKTVLGMVVGIHFLQDKEFFEEKHILSAIQHHIPNAKAVENSFFLNRRGNESICTLYLEVEKSTGEEFSSEEISLLRKELPIDLKDRIEYLMHPIFMPRNEEEIMRNVLSLSNQIKYVDDVPQVIISFDKQTYKELYFTIILVRAVEPNTPSIQDIFKLEKSTLGYIHDREAKTIGYLKKKYAKEATVFGVTITKEQFLRRDHSIDLNKARLAVVSELMRILGDIRDFNGGMISKQNEMIANLREQLENTAKYNELLLENFFYSVTPDIMRTVLDCKILKNLFLLLLESLEKGAAGEENYSFKIRQEPQYVYAIIKTDDCSLKEIMGKAVGPFENSSSKLASSWVLNADTFYLGYIFLSDDPQQQEQFCTVIRDFKIPSQESSR